MVGRTGTNLIYDFFISPLAIALAVLYLQLWVFGLPLIILPLIFIRQAYQTIVQLQQANRDLLTALVKAIETRDPYTSGHSLRVASLAVRIAERMGFSPKKVLMSRRLLFCTTLGKSRLFTQRSSASPMD